MTVIRGFITMSLLCLFFYPTPGKTVTVSQNPTFMEVAKDIFGNIIYLNYEQAGKYCESKGARLPSAREWTQFAVSFGAKGIVDTCASDWRCRRVSGIQNSDGGKDEFYFSSAGYYSPHGAHAALRRTFYWSSSVIERIENFYIFIDEFAELSGWFKLNVAAVRCVVDF